LPILECQVTLNKRKAPLLKTFWRRFCKRPCYLARCHESKC